MKNKNVVVTGCNGFIGRNVALYYANQGWNVTGIGHGKWSSSEWRRWKLSSWHECDVTMKALLEFAGTDVIVHCAGSGSVGFSIDNPMLDFERTVGTIHNVLEFVRVHSPKTKIVYPSSAAVYGAVSKLPIEENDLLNPISPYGVHKKIAEELCSLYAEQYGLSIAIIRLFSIYGAGLKKQLLWDACNKLKVADRSFYGTGLETRDWVHVNDVAALLYNAYLKADSSCPIVNGGSGCAVSIKDVLTMLFTALGVSGEPCFLGTLNDGNPLHYQASINHVNQWEWKPLITLTEGITEYAKWFREGAR